MVLLVLMILVTASLAGTAGYFSIVGLAALFSFHFWGVVAMGSALEAGKIIATSYIYRYWSKVGFIRKAITLFLIFALMVLTSIGISGYLMQGYQEGSSNKESISIQLDTNKKETQRVQERISDIEGQIANLPSALVRSRIALEKNYRAEVTQLKERYNELLKEEEGLKLRSLEADSHLGPIIYIAKELNVDPARAALYLVLLIVVIFDPLTILLTISVNHILKLRNDESRRNETQQEDEERDSDREEESPTQVSGPNGELRGQEESPRRSPLPRSYGIRRRRQRRSKPSPTEEVNVEVVEEPKPEVQAEEPKPINKARDISPINISAMNGSQIIHGN